MSHGCLHTTRIEGFFCIYSTIQFVHFRHSGTYDFKHELGLIRDALSLSVDTLNSNLHDLTAQLLGRLMLHIRDDSSLQCR